MLSLLWPLSTKEILKSCYCSLQINWTEFWLELYFSTDQVKKKTFLWTCIDLYLVFVLSNLCMAVGRIGPTSPHMQGNHSAVSYDSSLCLLSSELWRFFLCIYLLHILLDLYWVASFCGARVKKKPFYFKCQAMFVQQRSIEKGGPSV